MHDQQITYLPSNQWRTHTVRCLCCFTVTIASNIRSVCVFIICHFLSPLFWHQKWRVSWFNDFIHRFSQETKPRPQKLAKIIDRLTPALAELTVYRDLCVVELPASVHRWPHLRIPDWRQAVLDTGVLVWRRAVYAARERRHLHGRYCRVTNAVFLWWQSLCIITGGRLALFHLDRSFTEHDDW